MDSTDNFDPPGITEETYVEASPHHGSNNNNSSNNNHYNSSNNNSNTPQLPPIQQGQHGQMNHSSSQSTFVTGVQETNRSEMTKPSSRGGGNGTSQPASAAHSRQASNAPQQHLAVTPMKLQQQSANTPNTPQQGLNTPSKGGLNDRNIMADDSLFTENFVRRMSPRSSEACRLLGVLPEELVLRPYESFYEHGIPPQVQKLRYQDYEAMRQETIAQVRDERMALVEAGWDQHVTPQQKLKIQQAALKAAMYPDPHRSSSGSRSPSGSQSPSRTSRSLKVLLKSPSHPNLANKSAAPTDRSLSPSKNGKLPEELLLEQEAERMKKIVMRQNKEIEAMMAYELKVAKLISKQEEKMEFRRAKEEAAAELRREERMKQAERKRLWELAKQEEEERQRAAAQIAAQKLNEQELKHHLEQKQRDEERRREAERRANERRRKKMELELRAQQNLEKQYQQMAQREKEMSDRDAKRRAALEEKRRLLAEEHAQQKKAAMQRVALVLETNQKSLEEKKEEFQRKMWEQEERIRRFEELKKDMGREKAQEIQLKEERRLAALRDAKSQLDGRIHGILEKKAKHDEVKAEMDSKHRDQMLIKQEMRRLNKLRKQHNVERLKRMQDYHRASLMDKLEEEANKVKEIEEKKQALLQQRQKNAIHMFKQKETLVKLFQDMTLKKNWDAINKISTHGNGKKGEDDTENDVSPDQSPSRRRSGTGNLNHSPAPVNLLELINGVKSPNRTPSKMKGYTIDDQRTLNKSRSTPNI